MTRTRTLLGLSLVAVCLAAPSGFAFAQQSGGLLGNLFNGGSQQQAQAAQPAAGPQGGDSVNARMDRIEHALRQLTGQVEVLQHQNQMLQMQIQRLQGGAAGAPAGAAASGQRSQAFPPAQNQGAAAGLRSNPSQAVANAGKASSGDAFNPALHPNAPGVPRSLGSEAPGRAANPAMNNAPIGAPGGREAGAPLDLNALAGTQGAAPAGVVDNPPPAAGAMPNGALPAPPPRNPSATGAKLATLPPSATPKDEYELAYGYVLHRDYGLASQAFQDFLRKYPKDKLAPAAHYWLGESLFQQQKYDDAARAFLTVSTKYKRFSRAPNALLRLGQSLAALNHKEAACATLGEVKNKFPHASSSVKRAVARELKRVHC